MSDGTSIEWTDASFNPIRARNLKTGKIGWHCEHATTGCEFCYAEGINKRLGTGLPFKPGHRKDIEIFLDEKMLLAPLRWKRPRRIFVGSMTDMFADFVTVDMLDRIFAVMALCPHHTFQLLTKRAERMRGYCSDEGAPYRIARKCLDITIADKAKWTCDPWPVQSIGDDIDLPDDITMARWPLPNVCLGVSVERQEEADERIPLLLQTPAAVRFISAEPLLGPIDVFGYVGKFGWQAAPGDVRSLDWIIAGGESGVHARPMHPDWPRRLRDQCQAAGIAFFYKQAGEFASVSEVAGPGRHHTFPDGATVRRVGKAAAGRLLDGREHNDTPGHIR